MYKVYFTWFADKELLKNVYSVLCQNGFQCSEKMRGGPIEEIDESDVLICDAFTEESNYSLNSTAEVYHALDIGVPVVVIQKDRFYDHSVGGRLDDLSMRGNSSVFQMQKGSDIRNLPTFLNKTVEKKATKKHFSWFTRSKTPGDSYSGNKEYLYVSFAEKNRLKAYRIIKDMQDKGYRVAYREKDYDDSSEYTAFVIQNSCCLIALISPDYVESENCRDEISLARDLNKDRLLVYLAKTELSPGMAMRLLRLQAIHKYTYKTEQEFYDKLYSAKGIEPAKA